MFLFKKSKFRSDFDEETISLISKESDFLETGSSGYATKTHYFPIIYGFFAIFFIIVLIHPIKQTAFLVPYSQVYHYSSQLFLFIEELLKILTISTLYLFYDQKFSVPEYSNYKMILSFSYILAWMLIGENIFIFYFSDFNEASYPQQGFHLTFFVFSSLIIYMSCEINKRKPRMPTIIDIKFLIYFLLLTSLIIYEASVISYKSGILQMQYDIILESLQRNSNLVIWTLESLFIVGFYADLKYISLSISVAPDYDYFCDSKLTKSII